jgi:hypothetical protein
LQRSSIVETYLEAERICCVTPTQHDLFTDILIGYIFDLRENSDIISRNYVRSKAQIFHNEQLDLLLRLPLTALRTGSTISRPTVIKPNGNAR